MAQVPATRPFFMPERLRQQIRALIATEQWAREEYERVKVAADRGDGYWAAFLYALDGGAARVPVARKWLLEKYGPRSWNITTATRRLNDPDFFKGGQVGIPEVYYDTDLTRMVGFDWVHNGLEPDDRRIIEEGILTWARYKMRCMDRWTQTPNLVFKPTCTVAMAGLTTGDAACLEWGFRRTKPWGGAIGGYDVVLATMLLDGGPWREAPIYPIAHEDLHLIAKMSWYRSLRDGVDHWRATTPNGSSPKGLMDYYIDSAYPIERTGWGAGQVRVATYGDGATNARGDLFLANPAGDGLNCHEAVASAYGVSGDQRYAPFVAMIPDYRPDLLMRRPLPAKCEFPPAPSRIWPNYGLAMLRSDESASYWTSGRAIAVFHLMSQGYGHDHRDKFSITLHGAGRLIYPDYNAIQYENLAIGWTRCTPAHNTLVVDEQDTRDSAPSALRHEFSPEAKFIACTASVFDGVEQTRALMLTREYLLDLFHATSAVPHTYDYLLHSFGKAVFPKPERLTSSSALVSRYWLVDGQRAMTTDDAWSMDFVIRDEPGGRGGRYGREWYDHTARLRLTMAGQPDTLVAHGVWGEELARLVAQKQKNAVMDRLTMLAVRRTGVRQTVFAAVHEPYANDEAPAVSAITEVGRDGDAVVYRLAASGFTDYAAVALGTDESSPVRIVHSAADPHEQFAFRNYGYLRIDAAGNASARGGWTGVRLRGITGTLTLNGAPADVRREGGVCCYGTIPPRPGPATRPTEQPPWPVALSPAALRVFDRDQRTIEMSFINSLAQPISGRIQFDLPPGISASPAEFGPAAPAATVKVPVTFSTNRPSAGRHIVPWRLVYRAAGAQETVITQAMPLTVYVGPTLESVYRHPRPFFLVNAPKYTARLDMFAGLGTFLADDDGRVRLDGSPLFTFSDGTTEMLHEKTDHAGVWPHQAPAHLTAHVRDRCRWQAIFFGDRIFIRMDRGWTQFEKTHFTIPGRWVCRSGTPTWRSIVKAEGGKVAAAELAFPDGNWSLAFEFQPPQEVSFSGTELKFAIGSLTGDSFSIGFCRPGELDPWRKAR